MKKKKCRFCPTFFWPHPKVKARQKICGSPSCKKALKTENNARWRKRNPECCQGDSARLNEWLILHPGYLKAYRNNHPDYVQKNRKAQKCRDQKKRVHLDIQARLTKQLPDITEQLANQPHLDIQAEIPIKTPEITFFIGTLPCLDIQVPMEKSIQLSQTGPNFIRRNGLCKKESFVRAESERSRGPSVGSTTALSPKASSWTFPP